MKCSAIVLCYWIVLNLLMDMESGQYYNSKEITSGQNMEDTVKIKTKGIMFEER
jgi:hypothetical protein